MAAGCHRERTPVISVIATVLNEGTSIHRLLLSLGKQTRLPDEIVIVDGGSADSTAAIIEGYMSVLPLRLLVEPGANISAGRNRAIAAARGDIIAVTDAGVTLDSAWLEQLTRPLLDEPQTQVAGGFFQADPYTVFEVAMGATVLPLADEVNPEAFLPSSRSVAFRKAAWEQVGGYPEWLDYCEDLVFDLRLKRCCGPFAFAPDALVYFRPRGSLRAFFKQYYLYARGDGKADLWRRRHLARYLTYLAVVPAIFALGLLVDTYLWGLYALGAAYYLYQPYRRLPLMLRLAPRTNPAGWAYAALLIPVIRAVGDVAKMLGYPVGLRWRRAHQPPDWRR